MSSRNLSPTVGTALAALLLAALAIMLEAFAPAPASANVEACPNAAERFGASATLPDCRAYELVTPMVKEDNSFLTGALGFPDGDHVSFTSFLPLPGAKSGEPEVALSSRTESGWVTTPITPPQGPGELDNINVRGTGDSSFRVSYTSDFSAAFVNTPFASDPLDQNLVSDVYRVDIPGGESSLASLPDTGPMTEALYNPPGIDGNEEPGSFLAGNSADGSHVFFATRVQLPTAPGTPVDTHIVGYNEAYERYAGHTYVVGVLPDGSVSPCGAEVGNGGETGINYYDFVRYGAVAPDGSNVVFHTSANGAQGDPEPCPDDGFQVPEGGPENGALYLREDSGTPEAKTVQLPGQYFLVRTAEGSKVLSTGGPGENAEGEPIYEYDIPTGQTTTVGHGALVAYSDDGSVVYYMTHPARFSSSEQQLEVYDEGVTKTVPNAGPAYAGRYYESREASQPGFIGNLAVTTPDGSKLLFLDRANLTSYDAHGPSCRGINDGQQLGREPVDIENCAEAYVYDLDTGSFTCVSCNPSGAPPVDDANLAGTIGGANSFFPQTTPLLSEDGSRAFFQTAEALVPQDTNGVNDVYEWENGHIYLLSSGQGGIYGQEIRSSGGGFSGIAGSQLIGVSSDGDDVFILTTDHLLPQDIENSEQIYDARVDGGFPYTPPVYGCDSGQCQGPQTPAPIFAPPASSTFVGVGNPVWEEAKPAASKPVKSKRSAKRRKGKGRAKGKGGSGSRAKAKRRK